MVHAACRWGSLGDIVAGDLFAGTHTHPEMSDSDSEDFIIGRLRPSEREPGFFNDAMLAWHQARQEHWTSVVIAIPDDSDDNHDNDDGDDEPLATRQREGEEI